jgi:hypothetical protein
LSDEKEVFEDCPSCGARVTFTAPIEVRLMDADGRDPAVADLVRAARELEAILRRCYRAVDTDAFDYLGGNDVDDIMQTMQRMSVALKKFESVK